MARAERSLQHGFLVRKAVEWLRHGYRCGVILSEQSCATGEIPDAIGWKGQCRSVVVECKASRADFLADARKDFRLRPEEALGAERIYMAPAGIIATHELPASWGLLEYSQKSVRLAVKPARRDLRTPASMMKEMNLLLASLRRVEVRIEPQTITDFLKWKNRLMDYNGGLLPEGLANDAAEGNVHLDPAAEC